MRNKILIFIVFVQSGLLTSCLNKTEKKNDGLNTSEKKIDGPYFVAPDPAADYKTLYFDLGDGNSIERVRNIKRAGHTEKFIIAEVQDGYYFIDRLKDNKFLNSHDIIGNVKTHEYFLKWLDSLQIYNFEFDYYMAK